ncbi:hypothetical protein L1987_71112 [Smallanthus sonchifolius]|uniref:Uncharacterized protein n=1 Tax=Smallanthus sonchifolius TaxID=185202 RepID=A0ACB9AS62_9ASTR|nr:hypothetical protein L1987_71112 [Smallanthus sonchifolius]
MADLDPILLVSGVGGSILNSKPKSWFGITTRLWVSILLDDLEFRKRVWSLYNPETGYTEALDDSSDIVVPQDDYGLYAIDILDTAFNGCLVDFVYLYILASQWIKCLHVTDVYHFHDMINMLVDRGYKKGTTLFGYGYDFRQSNRVGQSMDGLKKKLEAAFEASRGRKVNVISHWTGGLLVSCFISLHSDVFAKYVKKWITIATPFQGAPGCTHDTILSKLMFGLGSCFIASRPSMHQLLVECPSIYEMLPNPEFRWEKQPEIVVWRNYSENGQDSVKRETYRISGCVGLFEEVMKENKYNKKTIPLPFNHDIYKWAATTRKMLNSVQLPEGIDFYNIYGTSYDAPFDVCYSSQSDPISDPSEICYAFISFVQPEFTYVDGDGTIPAESAMADGFEAVERVGIPVFHREVLRDEIVFEHIRKWLGIQEQSRSQLTVSAPGCTHDTILSKLMFRLGSCSIASRPSMHQLLVECPLIYEMLPNPEFRWEKQPEIVVWRKYSENGQDSVKRETYGISGCVGLFEEVMKENKIEYNKKTIPLPFNHYIYKWAATMRKMLNSVKGLISTTFMEQQMMRLLMFGYELIIYGSQSDPISDPSEICYTFADGFEAVERVGIQVSHRELLRGEIVFEHIRKWLGIQEQNRSQVKTCFC